MDKSEIGAHLNGLPPATARGLHNLFNKLLDEIHTLRARLDFAVSGEPVPSGDLLPGAGDKDLEASPKGSEPIAVTEDGTVIENVPPAATDPGAPNPPVPTGTAPDGSATTDATAAPADVPPAA